MYFRNYNNLFFFKQIQNFTNHKPSCDFSPFFCLQKTIEKKKTDKTETFKRNKNKTKMADVLDLQAEVEDEEFEVDEEGIFSRESRILKISKDCIEL